MQIPLTKVYNDMVQCIASGESPLEDLTLAVRMQLAMVRMERAVKDPSYRVSFPVFADIMKTMSSKEAQEFLEDDVPAMSLAAGKEPPSEAELRTHFARFDVGKRGDISGAAMQVCGIYTQLNIWVPNTCMVMHGGGIYFLPR